MMSGYSPAQLGLYGFRHRVLGTYFDKYFALSKKVTKPRVWDRLSEAGFTVGTLGVPQTYPPKKVKGFQVSGFLAPDTNAVFTFPDPLKERIEDFLGEEYMLDVDDFRSEDRDRILADIHKMTDQRFRLLRHFIETKPTDFLMLVEIGPDRIHHAFWRYTDPAHRYFEKGHKYEHAVFDYYKVLDAELEKTLALLDDDTHVFVVSDHGARNMVGGLCVNDWLIQNGHLTLKQPAEGVTRFSEELIDWSKTKAWAWGGYYARIFLNVEGREPEGIIPADQYEATLAELTDKLKAITTAEGEPMGNRVELPRDLVASGDPNGDWPDMMLFPGDLDWRAIGSVGNPELHVYENDTGPDDANHDWDGIFLYKGPAAEPRKGLAEGLRLVDVGPTILNIFGLEPPADAEGRPMQL